MCDPGIKNFTTCHPGQAHTEPDYSNDDTIWSSDESINPGLHDSFKASRNIHTFGEPTLFLWPLGYVMRFNMVWADFLDKVYEDSVTVSLFVSSVRSSNSHPNLLVTQQHPPTFSDTHRSSTLDFHFLSHYSYIKAIMLYKGNHWTHLLATCIPIGYNCKIVQDSAR